METEPCRPRTQWFNILIRFFCLQQRLERICKTSPHGIDHFTKAIKGWTLSVQHESVMRLAFPMPLSSIFHPSSRS